jgi:GWxTD domain-containing protein
MRKLILTFYSLFLIIGALTAKSLTAYFNYGVFNNPTGSPYLETYLSFIGSSLEIKKLGPNKSVGKVEVEFTFTHNGNVINGMKYTIDSPEGDSLRVPNFIDQQRFELPNGKYGVELVIKDLNNLINKPFIGKDTIEIDFNQQFISTSSIQLVENYTKSGSTTVLSKSGYDLIPYVANFYPDNFNKLIFYSETYFTDKIIPASDPLVMTAYIASYETGSKMNDFATFFKTTPKSVIVCFNEFNITELPTGNYYLVNELKDKSNKTLVVKKVFFQRNNPKYQIKNEDLASINIEKSFVEQIENPDSLKEYIRCLRPIANQLEVNFITKELPKVDFKTMKQFFLGFWRQRNQVDPEMAWNLYYEKVKLVNASFKTQIKKGYMTDRGRVYLKYGEPNQISKFENEPSSYPYEIWQYYQVSNQRNNRKFIFYNPDLVTNDYTLIHSDALGETRDDRWRIRLTKRNNAIIDLDQDKSNDHYGSKVDDMFSNPR